MNDGSAPWIKIVTRIFEDPKIIAIEQLPEGSGLLIIWFKLLVLAGEQNRGGAIYFTETVSFTADLLAAKWRCKPALVEMALRVFQKLGMIGIDREGTISILNWSKYQNEEGLARIRDRSLMRLEDRSTERSTHKREQAAERQRRYRQKQKQHEPNGAVTRNALRGVTVTPQSDEAQREIVTPQNQIETKKEKERGNSLSNTSLSVNEPEQTDLIQRAEAKRLIGKLSDEVFGTPLPEDQWPDDMEDWLNQALPLQRVDWKLIDWFYRLPGNHKAFTMTYRRQSLTALIENLPQELEKIRSVRKALGLGQIKSVKPEDSDAIHDWAAVMKMLYGPETRIPRLKSHLTPEVRKEIEAALQKIKVELTDRLPPEWIAAGKRMYTEDWEPPSEIRFLGLTTQREIEEEVLRAAISVNS